MKEKIKEIRDDGDKKMLGACFLFVGLSGMTSFILFMSIASLCLSVIFLIMRRRSAESWEKRRFPAGIPIAIGFCAVLLERLEMIMSVG